MIKNDKMIGIWLPQHLIDKIDLVSLSLNTNKSKYLRELLNQLMSKQSNEEVINAIVQNCIAEFSKMENIKFSEYINQVRDVLEKRKLSNTNIDYIILKLKEWKENEDQ
jgi:metal-responsive CopG/Arc/MetJ family transcriptional regulator